MKNTMFYYRSFLKVTTNNIIARLYILIALIATIVGNVNAQLSPISGGYTISALLSDSGHVYWSGGVCGGGCGTAISTGNVFVKVLRGAQPNDPLKPSIYLKNIVMMRSNSGNHILAKDCDYVYAFLNGGNGQLGDGNTNTTDIPVRVVKGLQSPNTSGNLENVVDLSTGNLSSYAVISDGTVMSWGDNSNGRLGDGTTVDKLTPVYVLTSAGVKLTNVIQVSGLENAAVALKADGTVWAWGSGGSSETGSVGTSSYAQQVGGLPNKIVKIEGGDFNVLALDDQGYLWNWGAGGGNQLGDGTNASTTTPTRVLAPGATAGTLDYMTGVVDMAMGQTLGLALLSDGKVAVWGNSGVERGNNSSALPDVKIPNYVQNPTNSDTLTDIAYIGTGDSHGLALGTDGTLYTWGDNSKGKLGDGTTTSRGLPVKPALSSIKISKTCPKAYLGPDVVLCSPISASLYAGSQGTTLKYEWYLNGTLLSDPTINYANQATFIANTPGTYKVVITDTAAFYICTPCAVTQDQTTLTTSTVAPVNATFCGSLTTVNLAVSSGLTTFDWYAASTGGSVLAGGSGTNTYTTPAISATTTYYVQDTKTYVNTTAYDYGGAGLTAFVDGFMPQTSNPMYFTVQKTLTINSVDVYKSTVCTGTVAASFKWTNTATSVATTIGPYTINCSGATTVPIALTLSPGNYKLEWVTGTADIRNWRGALYPRGVTGLITFDNPKVTYFWSSVFYNWNITSLNNCDRVPVTANLTSNCPQPVDFVSFSGNKEANSSYLFWGTAWEENNAYFEVQRSTNGIDFVTIGRVNSAKKSSGANYTYVDSDIKSPAIYYYRLKQVDVDGSSTFSKVIAINHSISSASEISIYPNPIFQGESLILTTSGESKTLHISIWDLTGKLIYETNMDAKSGISQLAFDTDIFARGLYVLKVSSETNVYPIFKFIIE